MDAADIAGDRADRWSVLFTAFAEANPYVPEETFPDTWTVDLPDVAQDAMNVRNSLVSIPNTDLVFTYYMSNDWSFVLIIQPDPSTVDGNYAIPDYTSVSQAPWGASDYYPVKVYIADGVTRIDTHAFDGKTAIANVYIPMSVSTIGDYAFNGCSALSSINLRRVTKVGDTA